jgi:hypothetical protein
MGSNPYEVIGIFFEIDVILLSALWPWGLAQPLTGMGTRNVPEG